MFPDIQTSLLLGLPVSLELVYAARPRRHMGNCHCGGSPRWWCSKRREARDRLLLLCQLLHSCWLVGFLWVHWFVVWGCHWFRCFFQVSWRTVLLLHRVSKIFEWHWNSQILLCHVGVVQHCHFCILWTCFFQILVVSFHWGLWGWVTGLWMLLIGCYFFSSLKMELIRGPWWGAFWAKIHVALYVVFCTSFWVFGITYYICYTYHISIKTTYW